MTCCVGHKAFGRDAGWASISGFACGGSACRQGCGLPDGRVCIERGGLKGSKMGHIDGSEFLVGLVCLHGAGF